MKHLLTIREISVSYKPKKADRPLITTSKDAMIIARQFFNEDTISLQETFMAMYLNKANRVIGLYPLSMGGMTGTIADIRLILSVALKAAATGIILFHNHPSGSMIPSQSDIQLTHKTKEAALFMDIKVLDHLILAPDMGKYYSFADEGLL